MTEEDRLRRRLERERAARLQAEEIAERTTRELFDRQQELILLEAVASACNGSPDLASAMRTTLRAICKHLGWPVGQAFLREGDALAWAEVQHVEDIARYAPFTERSREMTFHAGHGLPGRVLASGQPVWTAELHADERLPRQLTAAACGLQAGVAFPILSGGEVHGVMEVYTQAAADPAAEDFLRVLMQIGAHIGRVVERTETERGRRHADTHDPLTGLPNRALFRELVARRIEDLEGTDRRLAIAIVDIARFRDVNDALGHDAGERLIAEVGSRISAAMRRNEVVARLGGDEFAVAVPITPGFELEALRRLQAVLHEPVAIDGVLLHVDIALGVSLAPDHGDDPESLLRRADVALVETKRRREVHTVYHPTQERSSPASLGMVAALRTSLEARELVLHYQPKVTIPGGEVCGVEALVRWPDGKGGLIPPGDFIPLAESTGLIKPMTTFVVEEALAQARRWMDAGTPIPVAVNVSARNLLDSGFAEEVTGLLSAAGVPGHLLELEVTESAMLEDPAKSLAALHALRAQDIVLSIDDFGTGYSSLGQLKQLPVHHLKIDRGFVADLASDERDTYIVRSTTNLGHDLGLQIIAEGVEDQETLDQLHALGCDIAQGYFIHRPAPAEQLEEWLVGRVRVDTVARAA